MIKCCQTCGNEFKSKPSQDAKYCSKSCCYSLTEADRFWKYVTKDDSGCWLWTGCVVSGGYGNIRIRGRMVSAHRLSYELNKGAIPSGMHVCHTCDVRNCVNPDHLWLGTNQENMADRNVKARQAKGVDSVNAKLTEDQVVEIRDLHAKGGYSQRSLGSKFGVTHSTIKVIINGTAWKHVLQHVS